MENTTATENSTVSNETEKEFSIEIFLGLIILLLYLLSTISVITHLFKFFLSKHKQSLLIKNLTNYCACLLAVYIFNFIHLFVYESRGRAPPLYFRCLNLYLHLAECTFLLIMSFYTCMCIMVNQKGYHIPLSDERQFLIYSIIGWVFSLPLAILIDTFETSRYPRIVSILLFRLSAAVLFFVSLWYIRFIGWNRTNIIRNFVVHLRLLILTGALSIIPNTIYGVLLLLNEKQYDSWTRGFENIVDIFYYSEGFVVGLCFTFRKGTFENKIENPIELGNGYVTEVAQVVENEVGS